MPLPATSVDWCSAKPSGFIDVMTYYRDESLDPLRMRHSLAVRLCVPVSLCHPLQPELREKVDILVVVSIEANDVPKSARVLVKDIKAGLVYNWAEKYKGWFNHWLLFIKKKRQPLL
ncbi:hypothetical protein ELY33_06155 [Vreelandella andesensis]|uniref:Uncharacterized protein n=1 Tax=Vreelandella andesensis TaxID=447567 RepID=A0A3S0YXU6_9GAMM|nr:hypothetical protein [Halomonas andesensis]RUR32184.1 hypothetical protein ELY33_06155 [Halomonas andesensis]